MSRRTLTPEPVRAQPVRPPTERPLARGGVTEMEWDSEEASLTGTPELHLAELEVHSSSTRIFDEDTARALVTHWLLKELAPMLGIDASRIEVHVDAEAESRNNARQTTGLIENGTIYIHPRGFDPDTKAGRSLLAHETVHVAQRQITPPTVLHTKRAHQAAEHEAAGIARAFSERLTVMQPKSSLPALVMAAAEDAPQPALSASVPISRAREITEIHSTLSGLWISDGDVFKVMRILDTMPYQVAKEVVRELGHDGYELADNINSPHLGPHTASVIATYSALSKSDFLKAIDLDVFGSGSWGEMTHEVKDDARDLIAQLSPAQRQDLLKSESRLDIKKLTSAGEVFAENADEKKLADEKMLKAEADLASSRKEIEALKDDDEANGLVKKVHDALEAAPADEELTYAQRALNAIQLLAPYQGTPTLSYVAEKLDADGLVDTILETLPDSYFFDSDAHTETLLGLVQARLPSKNIDMVVDMLSYGALDWAITDREAKFAYRILLAMPLADQYRFRQRENGKYFMRLANNLPDEVTGAKGYREIEVHKASKEDLKKIKTRFKPGDDPRGTVNEDEGLYNAGLLYAEQRGDNGDLIKGLEDKFEVARQGGWKKKDAEGAFQALAVVGEASLVNKVFTAKDQILTETVVHDLDGKGYIEELFNELSNDFLFSETNRIGTVKIMMSRDPARAAAHARDLVSYGFLDWMVTSREAYLAYLCVKALPDEERASLIKNDAWAWKRIQSEMSEDMRQSRDLNMYIGDKEGTDRASVLGKLAEKSTWTEENASMLDGLLRMAIAMTEHKFAFERSKEFQAYAEGKPALNALVKKYKLAESAKQEWTPELLKGNKWYQEGVFETLRTIWSGLVFLFDNDLLLVTRSLGGFDLNLNQAQDVMGGDLLGARLADPSKPKDAEQKPNPDANKLTLLVDVGAHAVTVVLPDLILDSVNFQSPGGTIEAGSVRLRNLKIYASYDTEDMNQPTSAQINIGSFEMGDLLLAMREKMVTASRLLLTALHLGAGTKDTTTRSKSMPRGGYYFPFPFLATIGTAIYYLFKFKGWGTDTPGTEMSHGMEQVRALDLTFSNLEVQGLTTSGGQTVGNLKIADFALRIGMNKTTLLRAQIASLDNQKRRKEQQKNAGAVKEIESRQQQLGVELRKLEADEKWMISAQNRIIHDKLEPDEANKLQDKINTLKFEAEGGTFLDIGSIDASGISGGVTVKAPIHLEGLHGEGKTNNMAGGLGIGIVTDAQLIDQMAVGSRAKLTPLSNEGGEFRLDIDKFHTEGLSVGGGQIRSVSDIEAKMKEIDRDKTKPEIAPLYEQLQDLLPQAQRYEQYVQIGVSALDQMQLDDFRNLRTVLAKDPSIVFGSIDLIRAHLDVNLSTGGIGIGADQAVLKNITMPEKGLSVDEVRGADLRANASVDKGLSGWLDWKKNLSGGGLHAGLLEISGARDRNSGLLFEHATLKGGDAKVSEHGNVATAGFDKLTIEGLGLEPRLNLMRRRSAALEQNHKPTAQERKERDRLRKDVPALEVLVDRRTQAVAVLNKAKTDEERTAATQNLSNLDALIAANLADYGSAHIELDDFGVKVTSAANVLDDMLDGGFDRSKLLKRGVTIEGTGKDHQVLGHASLGYRSPAPDDARVGKTDVEADSLKLNASIKQDETTNNITVTIAQLDLSSISLSEIMLSGMDPIEGGAKIWSSGRSTLSGLQFSGSMMFAPVGNPEGDYRLAHIDITKFGIASIDAKGFGYANSEQKMEVLANSATVTGVNAEGMSIDLPADKNADAVIMGKASIESISNADISAALPGGMELSHGVLDAKKLGIEFLKGGGQTLSTTDLSLKAADFRGPDGWAHFSLEHLSGSITMDKNGYKLQNVKLQKLTVPSLDWKTGETGRVTADKPVELNGLSVDGQIDMKEEDIPAKKGETPKPGAKSKKASKLVGVHINTFRLDSLTAEHLTYKDGDTVIDVGLPKDSDKDKDIPEFMKKFKPFYIKDFTMQGVDWNANTGINKGEINIEKYGASVVYQDLKEHLKTGGALTGTGMHASFTGRNTGTATLGKIDRIAGFLKDKDISTRFATMNIMESFTFGENFIEMNNLTVDNPHVGNTKYGEGTDTQVGITNTYMDKITIDKIHVDYAKTKGKDGKETTKVTGIHVPEVKFINIRGSGFSYLGKSKEKTKDDKTVEKTNDVKADYVNIDQLRLVNIDYDPEKLITKLGIRLDETPGKKQYPGVKSSALEINGIVGKFTNEFSDGKTVAEFAANLESGTASSDDIELKTVKLDDGSGKTRTVPSGSFSLSRIGLTNITGSYTNKKGNKTELRNKYGERQASLEFTGVTPTLDADGTLRIPNINGQAKNFEITRGNMSISIPLLDIENLAMGMRGVGTKEGIHDFGLKLGKLSEKNMAIYMYMHSHKQTKEEADAAMADPVMRFFAEPLSQIDGDVKLNIPEIPGNPGEKVAITYGSLYFINAHPVNIGMDEKGLYLAARWGGEEHARIHIHKMKPLPGLMSDFMTSGGLNIKELVEGIVNAPPTPYDPDAKDPEASSKLNWAKIQTGPDGLSLGTGRLGVSLSGEKEPGPNDFYLELENGAAGRNVIHIPESTLGEDIRVNIPKLHAKQIVFPGGKTGAADFNVFVDVQGLATLDMRIMIGAPQGTIKDIEFGDMSVLSTDDAQPAGKGAATP